MISKRGDDKMDCAGLICRQCSSDPLVEARGAMGEPFSSFLAYRDVKAVATLLLLRSALDDESSQRLTFQLTFTFRYLTRFSAQAPADGWKAAQVAKEEKVSLLLACGTGTVLAGE